MSDRLLVLDAHYLCHRAWHAQGHLSFNGKSTGVVFGFLKSIGTFFDEFQTDRIAFCFEGLKSVRKAIYPEYKAKREVHKDIEEKREYDFLGAQIHALHDRYLPRIGFKNIFRFPYLESDDIMAAIAGATPADQETILVTADSDLFQCLRPNVFIWSPQKHKLISPKWFRKEYGIEPEKWALVKAIAGCHCDNVRGIEGIGEVTALKYVRGELSESSPQYQKIMSPAGKHIVRRNKALVKLPYDATPTPAIQEDDVSGEGWRDVCAMLGMRSISGLPPVLIRKAK